MGGSLAGRSTTSTGVEDLDLLFGASSTSDSSLTLISSSESVRYPPSLMSSEAPKSTEELGTRALKALFSPPIWSRRDEAAGPVVRCVVSGEPGVEPAV